MTIHKMNEYLDEGEILLQQSVSFDYSVDTLSSSYDKLHRTIQQLLFDNWEQLINENVVPYQNDNDGTSHKSKEFVDIRNTYFTDDSFSWDMKIEDFLLQYNVGKTKKDK